MKRGHDGGQMMNGEYGDDDDDATAMKGRGRPGSHSS